MKSLAIPRERNFQLYLHISANYGANTRWLDVGAGNGEVSRVITKKLRAKGASQVSCELVDIEPRAPHVKQFDGKTLDYPSNAFDFVLFNWVLHHAAKDTHLLLYSAYRVGRTLIVQEDINDGTPEVTDSCFRHDPCGIFRSHQEWLDILGRLGAVKLDLLLPDKAHGDEPNHHCPRRLFVVDC